MSIATFRYYDDRVIELKIHGNVVKTDALQELERYTERKASSDVRPSLGEVLATLTSHGFELLHPPLKIVSGPMDTSQVDRPEYKYVLGSKSL